MNADRLFMLVDTCANFDEVKHEFPDLDFLTYFYALLGYYRIPTIQLYNKTTIDENPSLEVITIFFRTTFKSFLSICRFYRLFLYF